MIQLGMSLLVGAAAAGGMYAAVRRDLYHMRRDADKTARAVAIAHKRIDAILLQD